MVLKDNLEYWKISLNNPEPFIDEYYIVDQVIIFDSMMINKIHQLREAITTYCFLLKYSDDENSRKVRNNLVSKIYDFVNNIENIEYTEFVAFWKVLDLTYSVYMDIRRDIDRKTILEKILEYYCERREKAYTKLGYSDVTIQALYDSSVSREKGTRGNRKLLKIIDEVSGMKNIFIKNISTEFEFDEPHWYFLIDKNSRLFTRLKSRFDIKYEFAKGHHGKLPDLVLKIGKHVLIIEAKHLKEPGGAQSKQIVELINFIKQTEKASKVHYVAYLDGMYFNLFTNPSTNPQIIRQREDIENVLRKFKQNYFVNSEGFKSLLNDIIESVTA
ncbi:MAG: hypothetical protein QXP38_13210 [Nitrososphaerota archaeon]